MKLFVIHTLRQTGLLILEDNRLIIIVSSYKRGISMHVKYILMILIIFLYLVVVHLKIILVI